MKKLIILFTSLFLLSISAGCSTNNASSAGPIKKEKTNAPSFKIAIVGDEQKLAHFDNISYQNRELSYLTNNNEESFDALIITKEAFQEADKEKYVEFFNNVKYPVFFFGIKGTATTAFLEENTSIEDAKIRNFSFTKGYVNQNKEQLTWDFHLPSNPSKDDKNKKMLERIFKTLEEM